jgi:hypothetical protein
MIVEPSPRLSAYVPQARHAAPLLLLATGCKEEHGKRYALFTCGAYVVAEMVDDGYSEHEPVHLLNPDDPESENRAWIRTVWMGLVTEALGQPFAWPAWLARPAMPRITASTPQVLEPLDQRQRPYPEAVKPFNFLVSPHVAPLGRPAGVDAQHFHLIAPYTQDARQWTKLRWTDVYSGEAFGITTGTGAVAEASVRVQSYGEVVARYRVHPEAKSLGPDGAPCAKQTIGLLRRRAVRLGELVHIGKETNRLEDVEQRLVHDWADVRLVLREPGADTWTSEVLPKLRVLTAEPGGTARLSEASRLTPRALRDVLSGRRRPRERVRQVLLVLANVTTSPGRQVCSGCSGRFASAAPRQRYCSIGCRERAKYQRRVGSRK